MNIKKTAIVLLASTSLGISIGSTINQNTAQAFSWHSSAIPTKLQGYWYATANHHQGVGIYRHYIRYSGEKAAHITKWRYAGNHFYKFHYTHSGGFTILLHYFGPHKITMDSFWHSYFR
ncbi:hypothetical protein [Lentilactobacillus hilgardii]|uniref:Uncharacterized protein n=1 Tax=Lentilactobacillus hilgardii TaxID=1588 RepID=A0A6P1E5P8_LENHI|nr:hypothetical protein [Lentilactobacillus hilgardii]MCT3392877.1 hypothetical protein [Lentilactobacillus hilgardii]QHB51440.1 hypothetical protein GQR93_04010 [Lentilactobacillus hilgardii]RRG08903.1 MAG: hypothetical protein DUD35_10850 [Lactobacillus sp.]